MEIRPTSFAEIAYLSTIRLLVHKPTGAEIASAFVIDDENGEAYIVTARHAVENALSMTLHFYGGNNGPSLGPPVPYETKQPQEFWHHHPNGDVDVSVAPLGPIADFFEMAHQSFFVASIPFDFFFKKWELSPPSFFDSFRRPRALEEVLIVGYPNDYRDTPTSLPLLRRGILATPLWLDHEGRPVFLVDTAATHGTSGGPVFYVEEKQQAGKTMYGVGGRLVLLGVFTEVLPTKTNTAPAGSDGRPPHLGAAYRANCILEAVAAIEQ